MIEGATGEEGDRGQGEDHQGDSAAQLVRHGDHDEARDEGDRGHDQVDQAAELGFWGLRWGRALGRVRNLGGRPLFYAHFALFL